VDLDTCWYGHVVLLFRVRIKVRSDSEARTAARSGSVAAQ
jgi:hypothetical protein